MEERFINPYTDYGFKKLFGTEENADLLISFLNALISDEGDPITSITYKNVEHIGEINTMRSSYFDVFCQTQSGADFIVEMQNGKQIYFKDRSLYYATIPIQEQGKKGQAEAEAEAMALEKEHVIKGKKGKRPPEGVRPRKGWDFHLKDVYLVAVLDFVFPGNEYPDDEYFHKIKLMDVKDKHVFYDKLTLIYLEMPKLEDMEFTLDTMRDKWMYALNALCCTDTQPPELKEEVFLKLFREAELANFNETQLFSYKMSVLDLWNNYSTWKCANQEGIEEGIAKGKELGLEEGKKANALEVARKMKSLGMDKDTIILVTGLTSEEIGV